MAEDQTWRELLGKLIIDPQERQRIADATGINPITLTRWVTRKSNPRPDNLRPLLRSLPQHRQILTELIALEFPYFFQVEDTEEDMIEISSAFYAQVINTYTSSPAQLRETTICTLILQQILVQLDPQQQGMFIAIVRCVKPTQGKHIRSLRLITGQGTSPWHSHMKHQTQFFGAESQVGHTLISHHPIIIQTREEKNRLFPHHILEQEESSVTYPILLSDRTFGSLSITSTQTYLFTQTQIDLIQSYVDLLVLAFEPQDFYELRTIELGIMPTRAEQEAHLASFQLRVAQHIIQATQQNKVLPHMDAETLVWQELEQELLMYSASS